MNVPLLRYSNGCVLLQTTQGFNDWTASGVEKEVDIIFRLIPRTLDDTTEMLDYTSTAEWNASTTYLSSQKEIYDNTVTNLNAAANLATKAGFLNCAAKARIDSSTIVLKHQAKVHTNNDIFKLASNKFKNSVIIAKNSFNLINRDTEINLFRACNNAFNKIFINGVSNCYKNVMLALTKKIQTVTTTMDAIYNQYDVAKKAYADFHTNNNRIVADAVAETDKAVAETLKCANLNKKSPVEITLGQVEKLNSTTSEYLKTGINYLETSINSLISKLGLAKTVTSNNFNSVIQPILSIVKYLKPFGLTAENEININNKLILSVENTIKRLHSMISNKSIALNDYMNLVSNAYTKYNVDLGYVSEANLTNLCVPKDPKEQISKEEEIKTCLANLFLRFSNAAQETKDLIAQKINNFDLVSTDVENVLQTNVTGEISNAVKIIKQDLTAMLQLYGFDPEMILLIIDKHFSLPKYEIILKNQIDIKANLGKIKLTSDSIKRNLNNEIDTVVSRLAETIKIIQITNPKYNLTSLNEEILRLKTYLQLNITGFLDGKYNNIINLAAPSLTYNFDKERNLLLKNGEKCLPIDLSKLVSCFEPFTTMFNNSLTKAIRLSHNTLTDTNNEVEKLTLEIKQYVNSLFNETRKQVNTLSLEALNKANPGVDFRKEAIIQYQTEIEDKIKFGQEGSLNTSYQYYLQILVDFDKFKLDLENIYRPLQLAYEQSYKQVPNQPIQWSIIKAEINKALTTHFENVSSIFDFFFQRNTSILNLFDRVSSDSANNLIAFTIDLVNSNCTQFISQKTPFNNCILDILNKYGSSLNMAEKQIKNMENDVNVIFRPFIKLQTNLQEEQLKIAINKVQAEIEKVLKNTKEMLTSPTFLKSSSQNALKEFSKLILYADSIKSSFNISNINIPFKQFQIVLTSTAEPIKVVLNTIEGLNNVTPSQELQNIIRNTGAQLTLLLEGTPPSYQQTVVSNLKVAIEGANANIEQLRNQLITKNLIAQNKINTFIDWFKGEEVKLSESAANEYCKLVPANMYTNCVQSYFTGLIDKLNSGKIEVEAIFKKHNTVTVDADLKNLIQQIKEELKRVDEKIKNEIDTIKADKSLWKANEDIIQKVLQQINNTITIDFTPTFNKYNQMIKEQSTLFNNVLEDFRLNITAVFAYNGSLTEQKNNLISSSANKVNNVTTFYNNLNLINQKLLFSFENALHTLLSTVNESSFKSKCFNVSGSNENFKSCVQENFNQYIAIVNNIIMGVNTIGKQSKDHNECAKNEVDKVVSTELKKAEEFVAEEKKKNDENNSETSSAVVNQCLSGTDQRINTEIISKTNQTFQVTQEVKVEVAKPTGFESSIDDTLSTWLSTIDFAIKLNPLNAAKLNLERQRLIKYRTDTINIVNKTIQLYLNNASAIESETNTVQNDLKKIDFNSLNQSCASVYTSRLKFEQCIAEQCSKLNSNIDAAVKKVNDLYNVALSLKSEAKTNINITINTELKNAEEMGKIESAKLVNEYNVTANQIITTSLGDFARYNITPYTQIIQGLRVTANQLQTHAVNTNNSAINKLNTVYILLNLHVYALSVVCPKRTTKTETDYANWAIREAVGRLYPTFPDTTNYTMSQIQLANQLIQKLQSEIDKLSLVGKTCDNKDLYKLVACVGEIADKFGDYFNNATAQVNIYRSESIEELKNRTIQLNKWRDIDVNIEYEKLKLDLQPLPEGVYVECNVTRDKLLDFAVMNMDNRRKRFNASIPTTVQRIIATANGILATNYSGIVNLNGSLQEPVNFTRLAINDVLASTNASQITAQIRLEPDRLIGVGINQSDKYILDFYTSAQQAILLAQSIKEQADELHKNTNRSAVEKACFSSFSSFPMSQFVMCNNDYNYQYELKLENMEKQLEKTLDNLQNITMNGRQLIIDNSNQIAADIKVQSASYAIFLYFTAGLPRPTYLDPYIKDGCLVRIDGDPRNPCIVFV